MIVCLCEGVSDRTIHDVVRDGARTVREISRRTRAGTRCASCVCDLRAALRRAGHAPEGEAAALEAALAR